MTDSAPARRVPVVNWAIVTACTFWFVYLRALLWLASDAASPVEALLDRYALIPAQFLALGQRSAFLDPRIYVPFFTAPMIHVGLVHFVTNMLFLWVFGDNVEDRLGHAGYGLFYLGGAAFAGMIHIAAQPSSVVYTVGASGGIAAVMGAYFILYPRAWVTFRIPVFPFMSLSIPALLVLASWLALQILAVATGPVRDAEGGPAWWAHIGGFAFGCAAIAWIGRGRARSRSPRRGSRRNWLP